MSGEFVGGALSFKGDKKKKSKKKKQSVKHELKKREKEEVIMNDDDDDLTEAERKAMSRRLERERIEAEKTAQKSHRERVEEFNEKLASQTELNDIPRVSAAGNG